MSSIDEIGGGTDDSHRSLFEESVHSLASRTQAIRRRRDSREVLDRKVWQEVAGAGWLGVLIPEQAGGLGLGMQEMAIIARAAGQHLLPEPVAVVAGLACRTILLAGDWQFGRQLLKDIANGSMIPAVCWQERSGEIDGRLHQTALRRVGRNYALSGEKRHVMLAPIADGFLVLAASDRWPMLCWVPASSSGVSVEVVQLADGGQAGTVRFTDVVVHEEHVMRSHAVQRGFERARDETTVLVSAELVGLMSTAFELTLEHLKTRRQFGKPIGSFQALQHRAADMLIQKELAIASLQNAVDIAASTCEPAELCVAASRAKARCSDAAMLITRQGIQLHGAIGITDDSDLGFYAKRAMVLSAWLGNATYHRRRYLNLAGLTEPERS